MTGTSLLDHFSALEDPRQAWKVGYPLPEILNLIRAIPDNASLTVRRKTAAWDDEYLFNAITQSAA